MVFQVTKRGKVSVRERREAHDGGGCGDGEGAIDVALVNCELEELAEKTEGVEELDEREIGVGACNRETLRCCGRGEWMASASSSPPSPSSPSSSPS